MPRRGQIITACPASGRPQDRAAHLGAMAIALGVPFAEGVEQAIRDQQAKKRGARTITGADQRARTEAKAIASRERRENRNIAPARGVSQMLLPID